MGRMDCRVKQRLVVAGAAVAFLVVSACAQPDAPDPGETTVPGTSPATAEEPITEAPADDEDALPGEPSLFGPSEGADVAIVGVTYPDTIALLEDPGATESVVAELDPLTVTLSATGNNWQLPDSTWFEVESDEGSGWLNARNSTELGQTDDATSEIVESEGRYTADSIEDLGEMVADYFAPVEPPARVVQSGPATRGDLHEVTYDVIGLGDDATMGYRLLVFGIEENGTVTLRTVERTVMCARGVTDDGLCV